MRKDRMIRRGAFAAWEYEKELEEMNRLSTEGWQLVEPKLFRRIYRRDENAVYRYQVDYPGKVEDLAQYLGLFREQGWEYVNKTCNGWYYFKKAYDPSLAEEEYEIFTDHESLYGMRKNWAILPIILCVIMGLLIAAELVLLAWMPCWRHALLLLPEVVCVLILLRGIRLMKRTACGAGSSKRSAAIWVLLLIPGLVFLVQLPLQRGVNDAASRMEAAFYGAIDTETVEWTSFTVGVGDWYYLELNGEADGEITVTVLNEQNETVFTLRDDTFALKRERLKLKRGEYRVMLSDYAGGALMLEMEVQ